MSLKKPKVYVLTAHEKLGKKAEQLSASKTHRINNLDSASSSSGDSSSGSSSGEESSNSSSSSTSTPAKTKSPPIASTAATAFKDKPYQPSPKAMLMMSAANSKPAIKKTANPKLASIQEAALEIDNSVKST